MNISFNHNITSHASHVLVTDCGILNSTILKWGGGGSNDVTLTRIFAKFGKLVQQFKWKQRHTETDHRTKGLYSVLKGNYIKQDPY